MIVGGNKLLLKFLIQELINKGWELSSDLTLESFDRYENNYLSLWTASRIINYIMIKGDSKIRYDPVEDIIDVLRVAEIAERKSRGYITPRYG